MKTKFITNIMLAIGLLLAASSCQRDDADGRATGDEVIFTATIGQLATPQTRMTDNTWAVGDEIGVYMVNSDETFEYVNMKYVWNGSNFVPASDADKIYYKHDGGTVRFVAYYPYDASIGGSQNPPLISYTSDIRIQSDPSKIDVLVGRSGNVTRTKDPVQISFVHKLSKLEMSVVKGHGMQTVDLTQMAVRYYTNYFAAYVDCFNDYGVTDQWDAFNYMNNSLTGFHTHTVTAGSAYDLILIPYEGGYGWNGAVQFTIGDQIYTWHIPDNVDFEVGKRHTWTITINESGIEATPGDILPWEGTTDPPTTGDTKPVYKVGDYWPDPFVKYDPANPGTVLSGTPAQGVVYMLDTTHSSYDPYKGTGTAYKVVSLEHGDNLTWGTNSFLTTGASDAADGLANMNTVKGLDPTFADYPAFAFADALNGGSVDYVSGMTGVWYLPAQDELVEFRTAWNGGTGPTEQNGMRAVLNNKFKAAGSPEITQGYFWSSTEGSSNFDAIAVGLSSGNPSLEGKNSYFYVRAIMTFGVEDPPPTYKVGDYYPDPNVMFTDDDSGTVIKGVAPQGIVFWLDPSHADYDPATRTGKSGLIVDLIESPTMLEWGVVQSRFIGAVSYTDGLSNTLIYYSQSGGVDCPAFNWIHEERNNSSPGYMTGAKGVWYLPSIGELQFFHCAWNGKEPETWRWTGSDNPGFSYASWNPNSELVAGDPDAQEWFNSRLTAAGGMKINSGWAFYCSSTEADAGNVWILIPQMSNTSTGQKQDDYNVRAVMAF